MSGTENQSQRSKSPQLESTAQIHETSPTDDLLIVGASARSAAESAHQAQIRCQAADLFADTDLRKICPTLRLADYPAQIEEIIASTNASAWMYTGALENEPAMIDRLARLLPLWGNDAACLERASDPSVIFKSLTDANLPAVPFSVAPPKTSHPYPPGDWRGWLKKQRWGAAGAGVEIASSNASQTSGSFFQRQALGQPCSGLYLGSCGNAILIGVSEQLIGPSWGAPRQFGYAGSIAPLPLAQSAVRQWTEIGSVLARELSLQGIFGVDAIVNAHGVWPVEVNPRWTASAELFEQTMEAADQPNEPSLLQLHKNACCQGRLPKQPTQIAPSRARGKLICFAKEAWRLPEPIDRVIPLPPQSCTEAEPRSNARPQLSDPSFQWKWADCPAPGEQIPQGGPIATLLVEGPNVETVRGALNHAQAQIDHLVCRSMKTGSMDG